jgi:hypothetical protein
MEAMVKYPQYFDSIGLITPVVNRFFYPLFVSKQVGAFIHYPLAVSSFLFIAFQAANVLFHSSGQP